VDVYLAAGHGGSGSDPVEMWDGGVWLFGGEQRAKGGHSWV
jgi:hypothetical protein